MLAADFEVRRRSFTVKLDLQVAAAEQVALLGRSGAGKSTALDAIAGLLPLDWGRIALDGNVLSTARPKSIVPPGRRGVGLLRQNPGLFPHLSVLDNIRYPPGTTIASAVAAAERMGLSSLLNARPRALSGGEAQRAALARALQVRARLVCLDEPFTSLDRPLARQLLEMVRGELQTSGTAALLVTHHLDEAQAFADRLIVLEGGTVLQAGDPRDVVLRPVAPAVAELVGYRGWLRCGLRRMAIHPELARPLVEPVPESALAGVVVGGRPQGARFELEVEAGGGWDGRFHCVVDEPAAPGTAVQFGDAGVRIFDDDRGPIDG
ncbi:MAG TPA: ATP-binding cassette domain-containing protein [Candidatus Micrarchaeia archaeon]|nr:ATP-binding cassette domain-containing protein [Candidatus Micrarchaeia archaeon]